MCFFLKKDVYIYKNKDKLICSNKKNEKNGSLIREFHTYMDKKHGIFRKINNLNYDEKNYKYGILHGQIKIKRKRIKKNKNIIYDINGEYFYGNPHNIWYYYINNKLYKKKYYYHGHLQKVEGFYKNGNKKCIYHYKNKKLNGFYYLFYPDGYLKMESYFLDDKKYGFTTLYKKKNIVHSVSNFKNNKLHGNVVKYTSKRIIKSISNYINGKLNGIEVCYNNNKIVMKRNYYNGQLQGDSIFNDENEKILEYQYYQNGKLIFSKSFNSNDVEECCICFENTNFKLKCEHNVCFDCKNKIHKCPICRRFITFI